MKFRTNAGRKSGGFALPEVLCAIVILSLSILAAFSAMSYALTMTLEGRGRMDDFSAVMRQGVAVNVWAGDSGNRGTPPADPDVDEVSWEAKFSFFIDGDSVTAKDGGDLWLDMTEFGMKPGAAAKKSRLTETPVFIIFHTAKTADDDNNTPIYP
jgi:prepilin-type N-terminal cleavage/methylation domain-containing protein